jgi:hypothetical protein
MLPEIGHESFLSNPYQFVVYKSSYTRALLNTGVNEVSLIHKKKAGAFLSIFFGVDELCLLVRSGSILILKDRNLYPFSQHILHGSWHIHIVSDIDL